MAAQYGLKPVLQYDDADLDHMFERVGVVGWSRLCVREGDWAGSKFDEMPQGCARWCRRGYTCWWGGAAWKRMPGLSCHGCRLTLVAPLPLAPALCRRTQASR